MKADVSLILSINYPVDNENEGADIAQDLIDHLKEYLDRRALTLHINEAYEKE